MRPLRVAFLGNFNPRFSTERHVARAFRSHGHVVEELQENTATIWRRLARTAPRADLVLWTRTAWDWPRHGLTTEQAHDLQRATLDCCAHAGVPVVGYHLDRWWGLARQAEIGTDPYFTGCDLLITADGGHETEWAAAGVVHEWLPPGVSAPEAVLGTYRQALASDVAFVGSWQGRYHSEWPHRAELVAWLMATYGARVRFWPAPGKPAVRGRDLRDLYASVKVLVGDSCLVGGHGRYCSDRLMETIGRGGFLVHPDVEGITDGTHLTAGEHLVTWPLGDWSALATAIDAALGDDTGRCEIAAKGRAHVLANHTYERRVPQILALAADHGLLPSPVAAR